MFIVHQDSTELSVVRGNFLTYSPGHKYTATHFYFNFITGTCLVLKFEYVMRKAVIYPHIVLAVPFLALLA